MTLLDALAAAGQWIRDAAVALAPPAIGASVSLAYRPGLTWGQRAVQFAVGVAVSWYAGLGVTTVVALDPFALQSVRFVLGMIAYQATPKLIEGLVVIVAELPGDLRDRLLAWLPGGKAKAAPPREPGA